MTFFSPVPCDFEQALHVLLHVGVVSEAKLQAGVFWSSTLLLLWGHDTVLVADSQWLLTSVGLIASLGVIKLPVMMQGLM